MKSPARQIKTVWRRLDRSQRRALVLLGVVNLAVLGILVRMLLLPPVASHVARLQSPLTPSQVDTCRQSVSRALLQRGSSGLVQASADGTLLIQLQRPSANPGLLGRADSTHLPSKQGGAGELVAGDSTHLRSDADAAVWLAFEALATAGRDACRGFRAVHVTVVIQSTDSRPVQATARVALLDLLAWSLGQLDDAELARRIDYRPPQ